MSRPGRAGWPSPTPPLGRGTASKSTVASGCPGRRPEQDRGGQRARQHDAVLERARQEGHGGSEVQALLGAHPDPVGPPPHPTPSDTPTPRRRSPSPEPVISTVPGTTRTVIFTPAPVVKKVVAPATSSRNGRPRRRILDPRGPGSVARRRSTQVQPSHTGRRH